MSRIIKFLMLSGALMGVTGIACGVGGEVNMVFHGFLISPFPCKINDDSRIDVNFGERIGISKVDGVNYLQPMNYQITCEGGSSGIGSLTLSLNGSSAEFDKDALSTTKADLGIRIYQNGQPFTPNSTLSIDLAQPPRLEAVPVKKEGSKLTEGTFEAWATLRADYQ